jgi:inositol phosphorylceramide mannosyltransferase catalytic subunit
MIPRIIHQIWIGPNEIPPQCKEYAETWKTLHPEWEYKLWTNDNLEEMPIKAKIQSERYAKANRWAEQSDIIRYYLIEKYGGIYVDIDFKCFKPIDPLVPDNIELLLASPHGRVYWICNGIIGAKPNHPIFTEIMETMRNENYHGPCFLTKKVKRYFNIPLIEPFQDFDKKINTDKVFCAHPSTFFFPNPKHPNTYAIHYALRSWIKVKKNTPNSQSLSGMTLQPNL